MENTRLIRLLEYLESLRALKLVIGPTIDAEIDATKIVLRATKTGLDATKTPIRNIRMRHNGGACTC